MNGLVVGLAFVVIGSALTIWTRWTSRHFDQPLVGPIELRKDQRGV